MVKDDNGYLSIVFTRTCTFAINVIYGSVASGRCSTHVCNSNVYFTCIVTVLLCLCYLLLLSGLIMCTSAQVIECDGSTTDDTLMESNANFQCLCDCNTGGRLCQSKFSVCASVFLESLLFKITAVI